jgi:hypothetical protein
MGRAHSLLHDVDFSTTVKIQSAIFELGAVSLDGCPESKLPEFAFIGRSNVGKSSLLNLLTRKSALARVSGQPGRYSAARISARMPVRMTSGNSVQALITAVKPGSCWGGLDSMALFLARWLPVMTLFPCGFARGSTPLGGTWVESVTVENNGTCVVSLDGSFLSCDSLRLPADFCGAAFDTL